MSKAQVKNEFQRTVSINQKTLTKKMEKDGQENIIFHAANFSMDDSLMTKEVGNLSKTYKVKWS